MYRNSPHLCWKCRGEDRHNRWASLSPEEKEKFHEWRSRLTSEGYKNMSQEDKDRLSESHKKSWEDGSRKEAASNRMKERWANMTPEELAELSKKLARGSKEWWADKENKEWFADKARDRWNNQSEEQKERILSALHQGSDEFIKNITPEEKERIKNIKSEKMKQWWDNMTPEEKEIQCKKMLEGLLSSVSLYNKEPNKNESKFIEYMDSNFIKFEFLYTNKTWPDNFSELFPKNTATGSTLVRHHHIWDFILYLNDENILVDIDGSVHDSKQETTGVTKFNDSKRPYLTDSMNAYIVQCYDNNITDETPVISVDGKKKMSFKEFIVLLKAKNFTGKVDL